jgi:hypothetical protein
MKRLLWLVLLLPGSPLWAKDKKFQGYVMNPAEFQDVHSYCIDTHNLPADQVKVIEQFVSEASKPKGVLAKLPWHRLAACPGGGRHAIVRFEFPHNRPVSNGYDMKGALLVFRAGAPSPIYETQALPMRYFFIDSRDKLKTEVLERDALDSVVRVLVHDWRHVQ